MSYKNEKQIGSDVCVFKQESVFFARRCIFIRTLFDCDQW